MVGVEIWRWGLEVDLEILGFREGRKQHTWVGREPGEQDRGGKAGCYRASYCWEVANYRCQQGPWPKDFHPELVVGKGGGGRGTTGSFKEGKGCDIGKNECRMGSRTSAVVQKKEWCLLGWAL